jgi:serine protease Do
VILALNDKPVKDGNDLVGRVADLPIGSAALLTVDRGGQRMDFKVTIAERSEVWKNQRQFSELPKKEPAPTETKSSTQAKFGIGINRLTEGDRQRMQVDKGAGVRVASVDPGSFADDIGLQEGDIILTINRQSVTSPEDVLKIQHTLRPGQPVAFRVLRNFNFGGQKQSQRLYVSGKLPAE